MKLSQLEKWIQQTLTNLRDIIQKGWNHLRRSGWTRSTCSQANGAWALYKPNPSWVSWGDLSRNWYITCPKVSLPCWKYIFSGAIVHFGASSLGLFGLYPSSLPKSAGFILGKLHCFLHLMLSYLYKPSCLFIVGVWILWKKIALEREQGGWDAISCLLPSMEGEFEEIIRKLQFSFKHNNN